MLVTEDLTPSANMSGFASELTLSVIIEIRNLYMMTKLLNML